MIYFSSKTGIGGDLFSFSPLVKDAGINHPKFSVPVRLAIFDPSLKNTLFDTFSKRGTEIPWGIRHLMLSEISNRVGSTVVRAVVYIELHNQLWV